MRALTPSTMPLAEGGVDLVLGVLLFLAAGVVLALGGLLFGRLIRPRVPHPVKGMPYECGEPAIGSAWIQFDIRFYVVALVFLVFDVEIALFYPWAVVFGSGAPAGTSTGALDQVKLAALGDMLFFFGVIVVGFVYLWRFGYLDWVRGYAMPEVSQEEWTPPPAPRSPAGE